MLGTRRECAHPPRSRRVGHFVVATTLSVATLLGSAPARAQALAGTPPHAEPRRHSVPMMVTGQILTGFGVLSVVGGFGLMAWGTTSDACRWGGDDCSSHNDVTLQFIGVGSLAVGGGLGLGLGIPLWVKGGRWVPASASTGPVLVAGPRRFDVAWRF